jgi:hypothetical protein
MAEHASGGRTVGTPSAAHRYRIVVRDNCGDLLASLVEGLAIEPGGPGGDRTAVVASVRDESELYGLLDRFHELSLHIVSLTELGPCVAH